MSWEITVRALLCACATTLAPAVAAAQSTWYVDASGVPPGTGTSGDPYTSIQQAIDASTTLDGDTILVRPGTYTENLAFGEKDILVRSTDGPLATTVQPAGPGHVVVLDPLGAVFEGFTVTGSLTSADAGILIPMSTEANSTVRRCIVAGNAGHGVLFEYDGRIEECTIAGNGGSGLVMRGLPILVMQNTIIWGNALTDVMIFSFGTVIDWNDLESGFCPTCPNISEDPLFWDAPNGDYHLRPGSPCIDAGEPSAMDPDGSRIDIGALTFDPDYAPDLLSYCVGKTTSQGCVPFLSTAGSPSASSTLAFNLRGNDFVPGAAGVMVYGYGKASIDFQGGKLCVKAPLQRTPGKIAKTKAAQACAGPTSTGRLVTNFNNRIQSGIDPLLTVGQKVFVQWHQRDPAGTIDGFRKTLSDGVRFSILP